MYHQLCNKLSLDSAGADGASSEVTQPVTIGAENAVQVETTIFALTATNVSFQIQSSNDMENWTDKGSANTQTTVGYSLFGADTAMSATYARLKMTITGSGKAIVAAGFNFSAQ